MNNTNPNDPPKSVYKPRKLDWDWREDVVESFKARNITHDIAEISMIDYRPAFDECAKNNLSAEETANMLISLIERVYNNGIQYK